MLTTSWQKYPDCIKDWRNNKASLSKRKKPQAGPSLDKHGVYLVAIDQNGTLLGKKVNLRDDTIIYVGKASLQTFHLRWTNTHAGMENVSKLEACVYSLIQTERETVNINLPGGETISVFKDEFNIEDLERKLRNKLKKENKDFNECLAKASASRKMRKGLA